MILMKDIIKEGNPILRTKCVDVELPLSKEDEDAINNMIEYLENSQDEELSKKYDLRPGVGLAAPQIGLNKKMLVILTDDEAGNLHFYPMINPKLVSYSEEKGLVHRAKRVTVDTYLYNDGKLNHCKLRLKGYVAVVFQHEYDHLNGILFVDRINKNNPFEIVENSTPVKFE